MLIYKSGMLFVVKHGHKMPIHWQYEAVAMEHNGRIGIILQKIDTKPWYHIYEVLIGSKKTPLAKGWIVPLHNGHKSDIMDLQA